MVLLLGVNALCIPEVLELLIIFHWYCYSVGRTVDQMVNDIAGTTAETASASDTTGVPRTRVYCMKLSSKRRREYSDLLARAGRRGGRRRIEKEERVGRDIESIKCERKVARAGLDGPYWRFDVVSRGERGEEEDEGASDGIARRVCQRVRRKGPSGGERDREGGRQGREGTDGKCGDGRRSRGECEGERGNKGDVR